MNNKLRHTSYQTKSENKKALHGLSALGATSDAYAISQGTISLLDHMSKSDFFSYEELNNYFDSNSLDYVHTPQNVSLENIASDRISFKKSQAFKTEKMFFSFVPAVDKRSNKGFFYIHLGQPEVKEFYEDDYSIIVSSAERDILKDYSSYENDRDSQMLLSKTYPLAFLRDTSRPADGFVATFNGYSRQEEYMYQLANVLLEKIIDLTIIKIKTSNGQDTTSEIFTLLKMFVGACINKSNLDDVAQGIARGVVEKLKEDYLTACSRAWTKFEIHRMFGENSISFLDPKSKNIIEKAKVTDTDFENFRTALVVAIKKTIQDRQVALSEVYQQLIGAQNIQEANTEIASLNEQISKVEAEKSALAQQKIQKTQDLSKEERELKQELGEKEKEIKELEVELEAKKNQAETILREVEILNQQKKEKERQIQVTTTLALTGVIAGGIFWYTSRKKK